MPRAIRTIEEKARDLTSKLFAQYAKEYVDGVPRTVERAALRLEEVILQARTQAIKDLREGKVWK